MGLETGTTIAALNAAWPLGTDPRSQGDDHLRLVKVVMQADALSKAAGGTVAGALTLQGINEIANNAPQLRFVETDQTSPAGRFRLIGGGGVAGTFFVQRNTAVAGDFTTTATIASIGAAGTAAAAATTIMTRTKGDLRYAPKVLLLAALQALADSAPVAELRDALIAALSAPLEA